ncbi:MAG: septation regulator SpoVG [Eubacterium sp.]|jgi:stage V sporulation protein G|nr:septation regulator SpoVG [Eubacterium sp.]
MEISDIRIRKILQEGRLRAVISLTIDNAVAVHDIKLVQGDDRMFVAMPSRRDEAGLFRDIIHPINPEARGMLEKSILEAYDKYINAEAGGAETAQV